MSIERVRENPRKQSQCQRAKGQTLNRCDSAYCSSCACKRDDEKTPLSTAERAMTRNTHGSATAVSSYLTAFSIEPLDYISLSDLIVSFCCCFFMQIQHEVSSDSVGLRH